MFFFFFKQKTAYEMRISDWSSDVCTSDLSLEHPEEADLLQAAVAEALTTARTADIAHSGVATVSTVGMGDAVLAALDRLRSEERRVGKGCVSTCRSRWSPYPLKKKNNHRVMTLISVP